MWVRGKNLLTIKFLLPSDVAEFWHQNKSLTASAYAFAQLGDAVPSCVAEESGQLKVQNPRGLDAHQAATSRIGSDGVVREDQAAEIARRSVQGTITFHRYDAVGNHVVDGNSRR